MRGGVIFATLVLSLVAWAQEVQQPVTVKINELAREVVEARLRMDPQDNAAREAAEKRLFTEAGCSQVEEQRILHSRIPNVICRVPGASARTIIVGAHTDKVDDGTGIIDNWSGAVMVVNLLQSLDHEPRQHTFVFVGFSDEEEGLWGSRFFVQKMTRADAAAVRAMVNIDSLAAGPTMIWPNHSAPTLSNLIAAVAQSQNLPLGGWNADDYGDDDSHPFIGRDIPTLMVHSLNAKTVGWLHGKADAPVHVDWENYYQSYRLLALFLAYLDGMPDLPSTKH